MNRTSSDKQRITLKIAPRIAIETCGGGKFVSQVTRVSEAALSLYIAPHELDRYIPVDVALDIDLTAGEPVIARAFAAAQGFDLVKAAPSVAGGTLGIADLCRWISEGNDVSEVVGSALADGHLSASERADIKREIAEARAVLSALEAKVDAQ
ncbi:MAG: phage regulatory CII family protein [Phyllobacterium sp.]